jgi:GNAT superfamily N-acetyltransferase
MTLKIRTAVPADIPAMHRVRTSVRENRLSNPQRITEADYLPYIVANTAWVAGRDASIAGFAALDAPAKSVWALFVEPSAEGLGIGRALYETMLRCAREHGIKHLSLSTADRSRAMQFYSLAGWTRQGTTPDGEVILRKTIFG